MICSAVSIILVWLLLSVHAYSLPRLRQLSLSTPTTAEIIRKNGYPAENHKIITEDGYTLQVFRIPHGLKNLHSRGTPLLLQHGLLCSSDCWILNEPDRGLGYILADAGYDVWIGNNRGNTYSRHHQKYTINQKEFWNFSFHEMGYYDLPAMIDYILQETGHHNLVYVGHSQGTTIFFVMASTRPQYNSKIKVMAALGPIAYLNNSKGAVKTLALLSSWILHLTKLLSMNYIFDHSSALAIAGHFLCSIDWELCDRVISSIAGPDPLHLDEGLQPILADSCPTGASIKQLIHFNQLILSGKFSYYDYGDDNINIYNDRVPPEYNISNISVPILLYHGGNDYISTNLDVNKLYTKLKSVKYMKEISSFNHLDYMWAIDAKQLLYDHVIRMINLFN